MEKRAITRAHTHLMDHTGNNVKGLNDFILKGLKHFHLKSKARIWGWKSWGFGFRVSSLEFRVGGVECRVSGFGFEEEGLGFWVWEGGFRVSGLGRRV